MPRGAPKSYDQRLAEIDAKIKKASQTLNDLKAQRKEIESQKQADLLSKVQEAAAQKGMTVEALLEAVLK